MEKECFPHVTILMATYNGEKYLREMIESILEQEYTNWKLIISDDGSKDKTPELIDEYASKYPQIERHVSGMRFGGACRHFMYLLKSFEDDYIMFCDQDDRWHSDKIRLTMEKMLETEGKLSAPALVHTDLRVVDENMEEIAPSFFAYSAIDPREDKTLPELAVQNIVTGCTVMMNRALVRLASSAPYDERIVMHDWWLALIAAEFGKIGVVKTATIDYRQHSGNSVGAKNVHSLRYIAEKIMGGGIREGIMQTISQGAAFGEIFGDKLSDDVREFCDVCTRIPQMNKIQREQAYKKYGFSPDGIMRKIKMAVWG